MSTKKALPAKARQSAKSKQKQMQLRRRIVRREACGVGLIALGLLGFLSILPIEMGMLGAGIKNLLFGLLGFTAFVIPLGTILVGGMVIYARAQNLPYPKIICVGVLTVLLLVFGHLIALDAFDRTNFKTFVADAYRIGRLQGLGTGALGAIFTYPIVLLVGKVGAYILTAAAVICCLLVLTRLSLAQVGQKTAQAARTTAVYIERKTHEHQQRASQQRREREQHREVYTDDYTVDQPQGESVQDPVPQEMQGGDLPPMQSFTYDVYQAPAQEPAHSGRTMQIHAVRDPQSGAPDTGLKIVLDGAQVNADAQPAGGDHGTDRQQEDLPPWTMQEAPAQQPASEAEDPVANPVSQAPGVIVAPSSAFEAPEAPEVAAPDPLTVVAQASEPKAQAVKPAAASAPASGAGQGPVFVVAPPTQVTKDDSMTIEPEENADRAYRYPVLSLLNAPRKDTAAGDPQAEMAKGAKILEETLASFNIKAKVVHVTRGPAITRYELTPAPGVKVSRITSLTDDIALNLAAYGVRIEAPIPGKQAVGIEVPNKETTTVTLRETLDNDAFFAHKSGLAAAIGKDIAGQVVLCDLAKMPHVLIAGATGSGKSVCINTIIASILYKSSPDEVKFIMVDPKVVELNVYNGIPHLLIPVVTDPKKASGALGWAVQEMTDRYKKFADMHVKDITSYNAHAQKEGLKPLPKIVIIIDELADLMAVAPGEVEERVQRLAQLARAAGMHLVIATQRPSVNVITGVIKANIPSRIAFAVASQVDSRTILDMAGAEKLLGRGDMLYYPAGLNKPVRVQGAFISEDEVEALVEYIKNGEEAQYNSEIIDSIEQSDEARAQDQVESDVDPVLRDAIALAVGAGEVSISMLQRKLGVGYPRAGKLIDAMEKRGYISGHEGSKPRRVLISREEFERTFGESADL